MCLSTCNYQAACKLLVLVLLLLFISCGAAQSPDQEHIGVVEYASAALPMIEQTRAVLAASPLATPRPISSRSGIAGLQVLYMKSSRTVIQSR